MSMDHPSINPECCTYCIYTSIYAVHNLSLHVYKLIQYFTQSTFDSALFVFVYDPQKHICRCMLLVIVAFHLYIFFFTYLM